MAINLLPRSVRVSASELKLITTLKKTSLVVLAVYLAIVGGLFAYWMYWNIRDKRAQSDLDSAKQGWEEKKGDELVYRLTVEKLARLKTVNGGGVNMVELMAKVDSLLSSDISLESLDMTALGKIKLEGKSSVSRPIAALEEKAGLPGDFKNIVMSGLARGKGGFLFELSMDYVKPVAELQ